MAQAMTREQLQSLTKKQLVAYADDYFGIVLTQSAMNKDPMIELILQMTSKADVVADVVPADQTQEHLKKTGGKAVVPPGKVRLIIQRDGRDKRQRPVFLGHNGVGYLAKRGAEIDLPAKIMSSLTDAIEFTSVWDDEVETAVGRGDYVLKEQESYPYSIIAFGAGTEAVQRRLGYEM